MNDGQPRIDGGIRGEGIALVSCPPPEGTGPGFRGLVPLVVHLPGRQPYWVGQGTHLSKKKFPLAGDVLPLTVDAANPRRLRIEWDEVATIDERLEAGDPAFTDPDAARQRVEAANQELVESAYALQDAEGGPALAAQLQLARELLARATPKDAAPPSPEPAPTRPTARVLASSAGSGETDYDQGNPLRSELLLSVSVPGRPRYGVKYHGHVPAGKDLTGDVPVEVDERDPDKISIRWDEVPSGLDRALSEIPKAMAEARERVAALPQVGVDYIAASITDPALREQVLGMLQHLGYPAAQEAPAPAAPQAARTGTADRHEALERLRKLRDTGVLTQTEFAAEKARLVDET